MIASIVSIGRAIDRLALGTTAVVRSQLWAESVVERCTCHLTAGPTAWQVEISSHVASTEATCEKRERQRGRLPVACAHRISLSERTCSWRFQAFDGIQTTCSDKPRIQGSQRGWRPLRASPVWGVLVEPRAATRRPTLFLGDALQFIHQGRVPLPLGDAHKALRNDKKEEDPPS